MNETKQKIMVIEQKKEAVLALEEVLAPVLDVTFVDSVGEADKKAQDEEFDLIVTDCVLPRLASTDGVLTFKSVEAMDADGKSALLMKVRDRVRRFEADFKSKVSESEALLAQSQSQQEKISELINERLRRLEEEKIQHRRVIEDVEREKQTALEAAEEAARKMETMRKESENVLAEKSEMEKRLEAAMAEKSEAEVSLAAAIEDKSEFEQKLAALTESFKADTNALNMIINDLKEDLEKSVGAAEAAMAEKAMVEEKLERIQEQWEKFAGNQ